MEAIVNQDYPAGVLWEDAGGLAITGLTDVLLTATRVDAAGGVALATAVPCVEDTAGYYVYTIPSTLLTTPMRLKLAFSSKRGGADVELYHEAFVSVGIHRSDFMTKRELRYRVASGLWPPHRVWQTRAAGGTTTTATLTDIQVGAAYQFRGSWVRLSDVGNRDVERQIVGWQGGILTFAPAAPQAIASGHWVEIYPERPSDLDRYVDDAFSVVRDVAFREVEEQVLGTDGLTTIFPLPPDAVHVYRVGVYHAVNQARAWLPSSCWELLPGRRIRVTAPTGARSDPSVVALPYLDNPMRWPSGYGQAIPDGFKIIVGMTAGVDAPLYDDSWTDVPGRLVADVATKIAIDQRSAHDDRAARLLQVWQQREMVALNRLTTSLPPGCREVLP